MEWGNLRNWLSPSPRERELRETREAWNSADAAWRACPFGARKSYEFSNDFMAEACGQLERLPALPVLVAFGSAVDDLLRTNEIIEIEADWPVIERDVQVGCEVRELLARRRSWCTDFSRIHGILRRQVLLAYRGFFEALPEICFEDWDAAGESFEVPLIELLDDPVALIEHLMEFAYDDETLRHEVFLTYRTALMRNMLVASGFQPDDSLREHADRLRWPSAQKGKSPRELAEMYLRGTPFADVLELPIPFRVAEEARFEHCHIVGGTGHGKTQLMQRMIHADLVKAQRERRSVVVIDSQGDLINKLIRLALFDPEAPDSLADRLVVIDPADVEFPAALNLFDAHLDRVREYRPVDRERVLNGVIELYEVFFGAMLGAELTQKQGVIFRYLARLMVTILGATIHTLMQLMEDGKPFKQHMDDLDGSARYFFQTEFFHPSFAATKKQILKRLWGVLSTPAFERMFAQRSNKLDLFEALNDGKIVLVSTAKDLLKADGSALFGRFFIAMLAQAALERSTLDADERTPTFVYVDEAQEYFDDSIETILNQARKYKVGLTLAHQTLDQLSPRLRSALHANTSFKCVGGVSAKDARALADEMRTTSDFIERMRRRGTRSEFAVWLKHMTPQAIRLTIPLGFLERQPLLTEEAFATVMDANRARYCGTLADVVGFELPSTAEAEPAAPPVRPQDSVESIGESPAGPAVNPLPEGETVAPPSESPPPSAQAREPRERPRPKGSDKELGKGGSQHRYVQHLIKGLAEERGFRATIEEPVDGGQIDVALHRDGLSIACEVSVTSKADYEAQNLAKCLSAGFHQVWAVAPDQKRRRAVEAAARQRISAHELERVSFMVTADLLLALDGLAAPPTEETRVRGYKVKVSHKTVSPAEAQDRRAAIARVVSRSLRGLEPDD